LLASVVPKVSDGLSEGDIVLVDFEAWTDDGELFDTTRQDLALEEGWDVEEDELRPMPILLGGERVVPGFEQALLEAEVGEESEVEVPPVDAFGKHDDNRVRLYPRSELEKRDINLQPGAQVEIEGQRGQIVQTTASRVRVDFNHPMAGKTLEYEYEVLEIIEGDQEKLEALIALDYAVSKAEDFQVTVEDGEAIVTVPDEASFDSQWFMARHRLGHDVFEHTELDGVEFRDEVTREQMEEHDHGHGPGAAQAAPQPH
jgi:FKBP-type peptidyl-prolyl cis-trans isomerase SlyD